MGADIQEAIERVQADIKAILGDMIENFDEFIFLIELD